MTTTTVDRRDVDQARLSALILARDVTVAWLRTIGWRDIAAGLQRITIEREPSDSWQLLSFAGHDAIQATARAGAARFEEHVQARVDAGAGPLYRPYPMRGYSAAQELYQAAMPTTPYMGGWLGPGLLHLADCATGVAYDPCGDRGKDGRGLRRECQEAEVHVLRVAGCRYLSYPWCTTGQMVDISRSSIRHLTIGQPRSGRGFVTGELSRSTWTR